MKFSLNLSLLTLKHRLLIFFVLKEHFWGPCNAAGENINGKTSLLYGFSS